MRDLFDGIVAMQKSSFIDYPGRVSALLFYKGCNLRCPFCHNAALIGSDSAEVTHTRDDIENYLVSKKRFLNGVAITGGEPTLWQTLPDLVKYIKQDIGYDVKLDSNGLKPDVLESTDMDYLAIDVKTTPENYNNLLGYKGEAGQLLKRSIDIVKSMGSNAEVRITCAPGIVSEEIIEDILPLIEGVPNVYLQHFKNSDSILDKSFFYDKKEIVDIQQLADKIAPVVGECHIRGL